MSALPINVETIDRREREGFFYGNTNPRWHDLLRGVFEHVDAANVQYCVLHGYGGYDGVESGDIDCIVLDRDLPKRFGRAVSDGALAEGCRLINWYHRGQEGHVFVLAREKEGGFDFFWLDVCDSDYEGPWRYYDGIEMLSRRRRANGFWATAPGIEFACYLTIKVTKRLLTEAHGNRLARLYQEAPDECRSELARFYGPTSIETICAAASSNTWDAIRNNFEALDKELRAHGRRRAMRQPAVAAAYLGGEVVRKAQRLTVRTGLHIALEGDEAAVQGVTAGLSRLLAPAFRSVRILDRVGDAGAIAAMKRRMSNRLFLAKTGLLISQNLDGAPGVSPDLTVTVRENDASDLKEIAERVVALLERRTRERLALS